MRASIAILALFLLASLFLAAGCGGEEGSAPSGASGETTPETTAPETTAPSSGSEAAQATTLAIISSDGTRTEVEVEIADDQAEQQRGLMERTELAENTGMLFVFDREERRSFWMRNTLIPLSIAYIDSEGRIVDIQDMEPRDDIPPNYVSAEPAQYALEVNQGFFDERGIEVGDEVELPYLRDSRG